MCRIPCGVLCLLQSRQVGGVLLTVSLPFVLQHQIVQYLKDMFDLDNVRYTTVQSLAEDILQLSRRRSEILLGYLGTETSPEMNGILPADNEPLKELIWHQSVRGGKQFYIWTFFLPKMDKTTCNVQWWQQDLSQHTATWWDLLPFVASSVCWDESRTTCQLMVWISSLFHLPVLIIFNVSYKP